MTTPQDAQPLRITLWGDSFSEGFLYDLGAMDFAENCTIYINRDNCVQYSLRSEQSLLEHDWANLDWQRCLDMSDIIVMEMVAPSIPNCTNGFIQALDAYLDTYIPQALGTYFPTVWDASTLDGRDAACDFGLWGNEEGFSWTRASCGLELSSMDISQNGLEISYGVPQQIIQSDGCDTVTVTVNDIVISEKAYSEGMIDTLVFSPEDLPDAADGIYRINIACSGTFNPKELGRSEDSRDLGIQMMYAGGAR